MVRGRTKSVSYKDLNPQRQFCLTAQGSGLYLTSNNCETFQRLVIFIQAIRDSSRLVPLLSFTWSRGKSLTTISRSRFSARMSSFGINIWWLLKTILTSKFKNCQMLVAGPRAIRGFIKLIMILLEVERQGCECWV